MQLSFWMTSSWCWVIDATVEHSFEARVIHARLGMFLFPIFSKTQSIRGGILVYFLWCFDLEISVIFDFGL